MDERDEPGRIEIELTSHEPSHPAAERGTVVESTDVHPGPLGTERGRLIAVGSAAAVTALLLGVVLGRAGSSEDGSAEPATAVASTTSIDEALTSIETPVPITTAPPTTQRARVTTTTIGTPGRRSMDVAELVADQPIEVIVIRGSGELVVIDPTTATASSLGTRGQQSRGPDGIRAGDGWILLPSYDGGLSSTLYLDDGTKRSVATGPGWMMPGLIGSDYFWRIDDQGHFPSMAVEYGYDGTSTGREIELPDYPATLDPLGGFAVATSGGVYLVDEERSTRLTTGRLLAIGVDRAVVHECDESLQCSYIVVDRADGTRRTLDIVGLEPGGRLDPYTWYPIEQPLDPTETKVVAMGWGASSTGSPTSGVVDLLTGEFTEIGSAGYINGMRWTPDGRFVFWLRGGSLEIFDPSTGESVTFSEELGFVNAFTIRPAIPSIDPDSRSQQPGTTQPGTTQPGITQPGITQPGITQPGVTQPVTTDGA
ncbi:MAG: hypothetical protein ABIP17_03000 [Ilumatobacteraceae bacterium]